MAVCGIFGCVLQERHPGLCQVSEGAKRRRAGGAQGNPPKRGGSGAGMVVVAAKRPGGAEGSEEEESEAEVELVSDEEEVEEVEAEAAEARVAVEGEGVGEEGARRGAATRDDAASPLQLRSLLLVPASEVRQSSRRSGAEPLVGEVRKATPTHVQLQLRGLKTPYWFSREKANGWPRVERPKLTSESGEPPAAEAAGSDDEFEISEFSSAEEMKSAPAHS